jgi:signal transduction histidine kinase/ActR/RegA family two-component response regulator
MLAGLAGLVVNAIRVPVVGETSIGLGSFFSLAVAVQFGPVLGALAAAIAFARGIVFAGDHLALACAVGEAVAVGWLTGRRKWSFRTSLLVYWTTAGVLGLLPLAWFDVRRPWPTCLFEPAALPLTSLLIVAPTLGLLAPLVAGGRGTSRASSRPLRETLFAHFAALAVLPIIGLALFFGVQYNHALEDQASARLVRAAAAVAAQFETRLVGHRTRVEVLGSVLSGYKALDPGIVQDGLRGAREAHPEFVSLLAADTTGVVFAAAAPPDSQVSGTGASVEDREYFRVPLATRATFVGNVFRGRVLGSDLLVPLSAPVLDDTGRVVAVIEASLGLPDLDQTRQRFEGGDDRHVIVLDRSGQVVAASAVLRLQPLQRLGERAPVDASSPVFQFEHSDEPGLRPERHIGARAAVGDSGWQVILLEPVWKTRRGVAGFYLLTAVLAGIGLGVVLLSAQLAAGRITRPLQSLTAAIDALAHGEPAPLGSDVAQSSSELAAIGAALRRAAQTLRDTNGELERALGERDQTHRQVRQVLKELDERVRERTAELEEARTAAESANQAKSEFLASMSHELRTPLNVVLGLVQVMHDGTIGPLTVRQQESLGSVLDSGRHLLALINEVLDLSKIEAGRLQLDIRETNVREVCEASLLMVRAEATARNLVLAMDLHEPSLPLSADPRRLKQILVNLLHNAVKFTPDGGSVSLTVSETAAPPSVCFSVRDTGVGIPPEFISRLFKSFVQIDSSLSRRHAGTGLGLALVDKMTRMHGGSVSVKSEVGRGSVFTVTLPLETGRRSATPIRPELARPEARGTALPGRPLVLVVDDEPTNAKMLATMLNPLNCRIATASDGAMAVDLAAAARPRLIIMDVQMPVMDGLEATRRILANPETARIPILALTALAMPDDRVACLEAGVTRYLTKPVRPRELRQAVTEILSKSLSTADRAEQSAGDECDEIDPDRG